jgi:hypothetical protein
MIFEKLSTNGYQISEVFEQSLLNEIINLQNVEKIITRSGKNREVYAVDDSLKLKIVSSVLTTISETMNIKLSDIKQKYFFSVEVWKDEPGYYLGPHKDHPSVENIIITYLNDGNESMGTMFYDDEKKHAVPYKSNCGLMLFNSDTIVHGMNKRVDGVNYRHSVYINWTSHQRHESLLLSNIGN